MGCIRAKVTRTGGDLRVTAGMVCMISMSRPYLEVEPDTVWVSPETVKELMIRSNTKWTVR